MEAQIAGVGQITLSVDNNGTKQSRKTHYLHKDHLGSIPPSPMTSATATFAPEPAPRGWQRQPHQQLRGHRFL
jgi:hypothetical protein